MFTIFHLFALTGYIVGGVNGAIFGGRFLGATGGIAGALTGGYLGLVVGRLPGYFSVRSFLRRFERRSSEEIRQIIHNHQYYIYHLAFPQLMARGEEIGSDRAFVIDLLGSDAFDRGMFGWRTLQFAFPEMAAVIPRYDPAAPTEVCRAEARKLGTIRPADSGLATLGKS